APAERAALQGILAVGICHRELAEILALAGAMVDVVGALLSLGDLLRRRVGRYRDQDVRDVVFLVGGLLGLLREELIDFAGSDRDALQDIALAQQPEGELLAHLLAVARIIDSLLRED